MSSHDMIDQAVIIDLSQDMIRKGLKGMTLRIDQCLRRPKARHSVEERAFKAPRERAKKERASAQMVIP